MDITPRKRTKIITLHDHTSKTYREIASTVGVSSATVSRVIKLQKVFGSISPKRKGKCGRRRKTTRRDDVILLRESKRDPRKTSDSIAKDLKDRGIEVSSSTVRRRLLECGRRARRPLKKQLLTKPMKSKRYKWALQHKNWTKEDWRKVIFSDETHFFVQGQRSQHVRISPGETLNDSHINQTVKHPQKKMFWGCFGYDGVGPLHPVDGMMQSQQYVDVLQRRLLPELQKRFSDGSGIFQQDLAPCHTSKMVKGFMNQKQIKVLEWPGNSPDVNPIENLWGICKSRLRRKDCTTKTKLIEAVIEVWFNDPDIVRDCCTLVDSMPKRVKMLLEKRGGHIKY